MCLTVRVRSLPRRWLIVLALSVVTYGISMPLAAYGVFLPVLAEAFGWSRGALSTALSINLLLGGVAGFAIGALADRHGPRMMLVATVSLLGGGSALITTLAALSVRLPRPGEAPVRRSVVPGAPARDFTLREALADPRQWFLNASWFVLGGLALMISVHVVPFARDQGISLAAASLALTAYGVGAVTGRVSSGVAAERLGTLTTIRLGYVLQIVALVALWRGRARARAVPPLAPPRLGVPAGAHPALEGLSPCCRPR